MPPCGYEQLRNVLEFNIMHLFFDGWFDILSGEGGNDQWKCVYRL